MSEPIPAATLVVFRDRAGLPPELLMVERAGAMAFAGGALVFPGGRIDPGDHALAARFPEIDPDDAAARICAIRETLEESGLGVGIAFARKPDLAALRAALHAGEPFAPLLDAIGGTLDLDALTPFARWCPSFKEARSFDTRFYLARLPDNAARASADGGETVGLLWAGAQDVLDMADRGDARIIFPTRRNLERLALLADFEAARAHAALHPVRLVRPWIEEREGARHLCIPEDLGYPVTAETWESVRRG